MQAQERAAKYSIERTAAAYRQLYKRLRLKVHA
jgi:hypothetical protein